MVLPRKWKMKTGRGKQKVCKEGMNAGLYEVFFIFLSCP
jgi:hypothetical protein